MFLIPFTLFWLVLLNAAWSNGVRVWRRSQGPAARWFRVGLRIRSCFQGVLAASTLACSLVSLWLSWLWLRERAGTGLLFWEEVTIWAFCILLLLLIWWSILRYERAGAPEDLQFSMVLQVLGTLLYPVSIDWCWPLTTPTFLLFLLLGGVLLWFDRWFLRALNRAGFIFVERTVDHGDSS